MKTIICSILIIPETICIKIKNKVKNIKRHSQNVLENYDRRTQKAQFELQTH